MEKQFSLKYYKSTYISIETRTSFKTIKYYSGWLSKERKKEIISRIEKEYKNVNSIIFEHCKKTNGLDLVIKSEINAF